MNKLLIAGVGDLNKRVAERWMQLGGFVEGLRLSKEDPQLGFKQHSIDLSANEWPDVGANLVIIALSARERSTAAYRNAYIRPIEQLIKSLKHWNTLPERILVVSSTRVYGLNEGQIIDDESAPETSDEYGGILLEMECLVKSLPCKHSVMRLSGIYGPGKDWLKRESVKAGDTPPTKNHWTNRIHIDDAADAIVYVANLDDIFPSYIVSDLEPTPWCEMLNYLRGQQELAELTQLPEVVGGKRLIPSRLKNSGFKWRYPTAYSGGYLNK